MSFKIAVLKDFSPSVSKTLPVEGSLMNNQTKCETKLDGIDLDQWRQEIEIFTASTTAALDAIVSELSNACNSDFMPVVSQDRLRQTNSTRKPVAKISPVELPAKRSSVSKSSTSKTDASANGSDRFTSIKEKLASRLRKN